MFLARADSNHLETNSEIIEIDTFLQQTCTPYQEFAISQNKVFCLNLTYGKTLSVDKHQIHQLLVILLDNAIKYTESQYTITLATEEKEGKCILSVTDTGIGISNEGTIKIQHHTPKGTKVEIRLK